VTSAPVTSAAAMTTTGQTAPTTPAKGKP
jgi:hypothetical protein